MKNQFIIPSIIIAAAILGGFWLIKPPSQPKVPDISLMEAVEQNNIDAVKQNLAFGIDVNSLDGFSTPLDNAKNPEIIELLRKYGGKTGMQLHIEKKLRY